MKEPKIRFKGFQGEWEEHSLSEKEFSIIAGGDIDRTIFQKSGNYPVVANAITCDGILGYYENSYRVKGPAVTVTGRGEVGVAFARHYSFTPVVRLLAITSSHNVDVLANAINLCKVPIESTGVPQLTTSKLQEYNVFMPQTLDEEDKLASYFQHLDSLIQSTTKKIESLKQVKAASLQSMFPQEGETTPRVRFNGFAGEWEINSLSTFLTPSNLKNRDYKFTKEDVLSVSGEFGIVNQIAFQGCSFAGVSVANYGVVEHKDIVYTKSPLKTNPYGIIKTNEGDAGIVSTLYAVYKCTNETNPTFVQYYFDLDSRINSYLRPLVRKGAKNDMKVSAKDALLGNVIFPTNEEQQKIASYFTTLDRQITLHTQRLEKLKQIKAACLDNMFV